MIGEPKSFPPPPDSLLTTLRGILYGGRAKLCPVCQLPSLVPLEELLTVYRRFAKIENGECIIGMQRPAMIPLIVFDLLVNVSW